MVAPVILTQPSDQLFITEGDSANFSVFADGLELTYQWFRDGEVIVDSPDLISGSMDSTLMLSNVNMSLVGGYSVNVTNGGGSVVSDTVSLVTSE